MRPFHLYMLRFLRLCLIAVLLLAASAAPAPAAAQGEPEPHNLAVFILAPLVKIYEGDTVSLPYMVVDLSARDGLTLAPLTPPEASVSASLGTAAIQADGLDGTITYTAQTYGEEEIVVTHRLPYGTGTGSINLTVHPRPDYDLEFFVLTSDEDPSGAGLVGIFSGAGQFANPPDAALEGEGSSDYWFSLWATNEAFVCRMDPPLQATTPFKISGMTGPVPLVPQPPGTLESFTLDLTFEPVSVNASNIHCEGIGGVVANFPWPAVQGDANQYGMKHLFFPGEGGSQPITAAKSTGTIIVTRIDQ